MGAPKKPNLRYYPKMIDYYEDGKIFDLLEKYGPLGDSIYNALLCIVYREGYYVEATPEKLARMIIKMIGSRWVQTKAVVQVIHYCADIGLLHDGLLSQGVITSVGIQTRYYEIAVKQMKRRLYSDKYLLIDPETGESLLNAPKNVFSSEETADYSEETKETSEETHTKTKQNEKEKNRNKKEAEELFRYLWDLYPEKKGIHQVKQADMDKLHEIGREEMERALRRYLEELKQDAWKRIQNGGSFFAGGYLDYLDKNYVPSVRPRQQASERNKFHNFEQRTYDYDALLKKLNKKE